MRSRFCGYQRMVGAGGCWEATWKTCPGIGRDARNADDCALVPPAADRSHAEGTCLGTPGMPGRASHHMH